MGMIVSLGCSSRQCCTRCSTALLLLGFRAGHLCGPSQPGQPCDRVCGWESSAAETVTWHFLRLQKASVSGFGADIQSLPPARADPAKLAEPILASVLQLSACVQLV